MRHVMILGGLAVAVLLAGCSNTRRCETEQKYQTAKTAPVPASIEGMSVPDSPSALRIPSPPAQNVPFGQERVDKAKGKTVYECLDTPPRLKVATPAPVLTKEEAKKANERAMKREPEKAKPAEPAAETPAKAPEKAPEKD